MEEVQTAIKELKLGKSVDPTGLIREVFIRGGSGLVHSITDMFNVFKKNFDVPSQLDDILITTMFKKKGSWKKLDNYRGIFIAIILQLIYEKVLKNRISGVLQKNMSKFQNGGVKGKSVTDNLFILKGIIDDSKYLGKGVFITFHDIEKCFDSLWLQDCTNALWDNGVQDDSLYFIYVFSKKASISINTSLGRTDPFVLENLVKQGTVLGQILNNCSLDRVLKEGSEYQMGLVNIKSLEFVDDIADVNRDFNSLCHSNRLIENIQHEKILTFSSKKCELLRVGFKTLG